MNKELVRRNALAVVIPQLQSEKTHLSVLLLAMLLAMVAPTLMSAVTVLVTPFMIQRTRMPVCAQLVGILLVRLQ